MKGNIVTCKGRRPKDAPKEIQTEEDLERAGPDHVKVEDQVHELLGVDGHQVRGLSN